MIIKISSNNPELLSILNKNPQTDDGLYVRPLRNGYVVGNVVNPHYYECFFQDSSHSYTNYSDNSIDFKSYCDPAAVMGVINTLFLDLLRDENRVGKTKIPWLNKTFEQIDKFTCKITVPNFYIKGSWLRDEKFLLEKYFPITVKKHGYNIYRLVVEGKNIFHAINVLAGVSFLTAVSNDDHFFLQPEQSAKYAQVLCNAKSPYFGYYLFIRRCCGSENLFNRVKPKFESALGGQAKLHQLDTHTNRMKFVREHADFKNPILFYGCGEFRHERYLAKQFKNKVFSYDIEDYSELHEKFARRYDFDWEFSTSLCENIKEYKTIVLSEVLEHNKPEEAIKILQTLRSEACSSTKIIVTMPNIGFNKYYEMDDVFRHEDHVFEPTQEQFRDMMQLINNNAKIFHIGDCLNGECTTLGSVL